MSYEFFAGILRIGGSLGLFLFGMKVMSDGIQKGAGKRLQAIMNYMAMNRFTAVFTGFAVTAIIQSSSAATVMIVSFVNAGLLSLVQGIGMVMGANIGTTVTGWIVSAIGFKLKISSIALPVIGVGFPMMFMKKQNTKYWGEALVGFGILFLGLIFLKDSVPDIKENPEALKFLTQYTDLGFLSTIIFIVAGAVLTIALQSSSAAMAITLTMAFAGWIEFHTAAAIVLGENIGTTVTAYLASIGTRVNAKRVARAHFFFNIIGVLWMLILFKPFLYLIDFIVPGDMNSKIGITTHLAMFHTIFNVANTTFLIGFISPLEKLVKKLVKAKKGEEIEKYELKYFSAAIQETAEINILNAKMEIVKMAGVVKEMFDDFFSAFFNEGKDISRELEKSKKMEDYTDNMEEEISQFLAACSREELNQVSFRNVNIMLRIVDELESIADKCYSLMLLCRRRRDKNIKLNEKAIDDFTPYINTVKNFIDFNISHLNEHLSKKQLKQAYILEDEIDNYRRQLKKAAQVRLQKGSEVRGELLYIDMLSYAEEIGDRCLRISMALRQYY